MWNDLRCAVRSCGLGQTKEKPPAPISISRIEAVEKDNKPGVFSQQLKITFAKKLPSSADINNIAKWRITVSFDDDSTKVLQGKTNGCSTSSSVGSCWNTRTTDSGGRVSQSDEMLQTSTPVTFNPYQAYVTLPPGTLTEHVTSLSVDFGAAQSPVWSVNKAGTCQSIFCAATSKATSDNYLSGTFSPAIHSAAQYTIDGQGSLVKQIGLSSFYLGGTATVSTDQRPSADPDSFLVSGVMQWLISDDPFKSDSFLGRRAEALILNWNFAGLEFDRQTTTKTFISSPILEVPFRVFGHSDSRVSLGMFPYAGIETGSNLSNALMPDGSGFVLRGEVGTSFSLKVKTPWKVMSAIVVSAAYTARIPAVDEIFTNTHYISATGKTVSLYTTSTQVRNHLKDEIDFTIAKPVSVTIKHEYGEVPPGFRTIHNKVTVGLTVMLFQNNTASSKISAEQ